MVSAVCKSNAPKAAAEVGGAADKATEGKYTKYRSDMAAHGSTAYLQPLAFDSEGFVSPVVVTLLAGWAKLWADNQGLDAKDAGFRKTCWLNELAVIHARCLASCILNRSRVLAEEAACGRRVPTRPPKLSDTLVEAGRC